MSNRELRNDEPVLEEQKSEQEQAAKPAAAAPKKKGPAMLAGIELVKWDGEKASLPPAVYGKPSKDGKPGKFLKPGLARHTLQPAGHRRYKLLAVCRSKGGVSRRLLALLRDEKSHPAAQNLIKRLKSEGFLVR